MPEIFRLEKLTHRFKNGNHALKEIDLAVSSGEFVVVAGRIGSGKTLLARHLVGLTTPTAGKIFYRSAPLDKNLKTLRAEVAFVFQDTDSQILGQTVEEDVEFGPSNSRLSIGEVRERAAEALAATRLTGKELRRPETLSGGEKRRLAIAGVLAARPECLILDEPFANLDYESARDIERICAGLKVSGKTVIVITHELEKIVRLADRLVILDSGEKRYDGAPKDADPETFFRYGLACPYREFFPWTLNRNELG